MGYNHSGLIAAFSILRWPTSWVLLDIVFHWIRLSMTTSLWMARRFTWISSFVLFSLLAALPYNVADLLELRATIYLKAVTLAMPQLNTSNAHCFDKWPTYISHSETSILIDPGQIILCCHYLISSVSAYVTYCDEGPLHLIGCWTEDIMFHYRWWIRVSLIQQYIILVGFRMSIPKCHFSPYIADCSLNQTIIAHISANQPFSIVCGHLCLSLNFLWHIIDSVFFLRNLIAILR